MAYPRIDTAIEPPGLDEDEDDGPPRIMIGCWLSEVDDTSRSGVSHVPAHACDEMLADAMVRAMVGAASMRSSGLVAALHRRMIGQ